MRGVWFYKDANGGRVCRKTFPDGVNGLAVFVENRHWNGREILWDSIASVFEGSGDGPYASTSVSGGFRRNQCKRITEGEAKKLFPKLYSILKEN